MTAKPVSYETFSLSKRQYPWRFCVSKGWVRVRWECSPIGWKQYGRVALKQYGQSCSLRMHTNEENGVADEAIVIEWVVSSASWDFKVVKKRWGCALLSVKCCCFVQTLSWGSRKKKKKKKKKQFRRFGNFLVRYFRDSFSVNHT